MVSLVLVGFVSASIEGGRSRPGEEDGSPRRGGGGAAVFCAFGRCRSDQAPEVCVEYIDQNCWRDLGFIDNTSAFFFCSSTPEFLDPVL